MKEINPTLAEVVKLLNDDEFHDGTSIGRQLNITRAAVWKVIQKLEHYNIKVESIKNKGYRLQQPLQLLEPNIIKQNLDAKNIHLKVFESINSTSEYLIKNISQQKKINICLTETQTSGRGRFQRFWHSPFGQNIYMSLAIPFYKDISELSGLSLVVGLAICAALDNTTEIAKPLFVKWPNDIISDGKKLAGSLIEIQAKAHDMCHVIIGIGINVNMQNDSEHQITQAWTSINKLTQQYTNRNLLSAAIINHLMTYVNRFTESGFVTFKQEWETRDFLHNKSIKLKSVQKNFSGIGAGINHHGHLKLKFPDNSELAFSSGETTLAIKSSVR